MSDVTKIIKFKVLITLMTLLSMGSTARADAHDPSLVCPEFSEGQFPEKNERKIVGEHSATLEVRWKSNELMPQLRLGADAIERTLNDIIRVHFNYFGKPPEKIKLFQYPLNGGLGALYCKSYQTEDNAITLLVSPITLESPKEFMRVVSHELVHHWFYKSKKKQPTWLEEGTAYLLEYLTTSRLAGAPVIIHMENPWTSLTTPSTTLDISVARASRDGHAQLFMSYLYRNLGDSFLSAYLRSTGSGMDSLSDSISTNIFGWTSIRDAFRDFQIAKWLNRIDYTQIDEVFAQRYFLFPTTISHRNFKVDNVAIEAWSSVMVENFRDLGRLRKPNHAYEDFILIDSVQDPIYPTKVKSYVGNRTKQRIIRIIYD